MRVFFGIYIRVLNNERFSSMQEVSLHALMSCILPDGTFSFKNGREFSKTSHHLWIMEELIGIVVLFTTLSAIKISFVLNIQKISSV